MRYMLRLLGTTALAVAIASAPLAPGLVHTARAQVPTTDSLSIENIIQTIQTIQQQINQMTEMLQYAEQTVNQLTSLNGILGLIGASGNNFGGLDISGLISTVKLGISTVRSAQNLINVASNFPGAIESIVSGNLSMMQGMSAQQLIERVMTSVDPRLAQGVQLYQSIASGSATPMSALQGLSNVMYVNNAYSPTAAQVDQTTAMRRLVLQKTTLLAMSTSIQMRQQLGQNGQQDAQTLAAGVTNATNERGDLQIQSAILLKILESLQAGNALMSHQLSVQAATTISQDSIRGPDVQAPTVQANTP